MSLDDIDVEAHLRRRDLNFLDWGSDMYILKVFKHVLWVRFIYGYLYVFDSIDGLRYVK